MAHEDYKKFPPINLGDKFPFGKNKGILMADVVSDNPEYLIWLRQMRWNAGDEGDVGLCPEAHQLLDEYLDGNNRLIGKGYRFRYPDAFKRVEIADSMPEAPQQEPAQPAAGWASW